MTGPVDPSVFPAYAGVSRRLNVPVEHLPGLPRLRGGEPIRCASTRSICAPGTPPATAGSTARVSAFRAHRSMTSGALGDAPKRSGKRRCRGLLSLRRSVPGHHRLMLINHPCGETRTSHRRTGDPFSWPAQTGILLERRGPGPSVEPGPPCLPAFAASPPPSSSSGAAFVAELTHRNHGGRQIDDRCRQLQRLDHKVSHADLLPAPPCDGTRRGPVARGWAVKPATADRRKFWGRSPERSEPGGPKVSGGSVSGGLDRSGSPRR